MTEQKHWAVDFIGRPWEAEGVGPDTFNCWTLLSYIYREHHGIHIKLVDSADPNSLLSSAKAFKKKDNYQDWVPVQEPRNYDGVELSHAKDPHHVGLWLDVDGGGVLHCVEGLGVVFFSRGNLLISGWKIKGFWRHKCLA